MEASNDYENSTWAAEEILQKRCSCMMWTVISPPQAIYDNVQFKNMKNRNMSLSFYSKESEPEHLAIALKWTYLLILHLDHNFTKFYS